MGKSPYLSVLLGPRFYHLQIQFYGIHLKGSSIRKKTNVAFGLPHSYKSLFWYSLNKTEELLEERMKISCVCVLSQCSLFQWPLFSNPNYFLIIYGSESFTRWLVGCEAGRGLGCGQPQEAQGQLWKGHRQPWMAMERVRGRPWKGLRWLQKGPWKALERGARPAIEGVTDITRRHEGRRALTPSHKGTRVCGVQGWGWEGMRAQGWTGERVHALVPSHPCAPSPSYPLTLVPSLPCTFVPSHHCFLLPLCSPTLVSFHSCSVQVSPPLEPKTWKVHDGRAWRCKGMRAI